MTRDCQTIDAMGDSVTLRSALSPGVWFWRLYGLAAGTVRTAASPVWQFTVPARSAQANTSWGTGLRDINGDGYDDVVIGAESANDGRGRVYVYMGSASGLNTTAAGRLETVSSGEFGNYVGIVGDVNGDGHADAIVGDFAGDHFFLGTASGLNPTPAVRNRDDSDQFFGAGDVNGDGFADVLYSAPSTFLELHLLLGSPSGLNPATPAAMLSPGSSVGRSAAPAGDVNGDGFADVIVSVTSENSHAGRVYLYLGGPSGLNTTPVVTLEEEARMRGPNREFGARIRSAGDVNGDGYADVLVGTLSDGPRRVYLYLGGPSGLSTTPAATLNGDPRDDFGYSVVSAGDINGDGYGDVAIGAPFTNDGNGRVYVYMGSASGLNTTPAATLEGSTTGGGSFGRSIASGKDVNGDGYADVVVAAYGYNTFQGRVLVYLGGPSGLNTTPAVTLDGPLPRENFGSSVASARNVRNTQRRLSSVGSLHLAASSHRASFNTHCTRTDTTPRQPQTRRSS